MDKPFYHNSKSARTAGKQSQGTYKQRSFIIGQNRRDVKLKKSVSCAQKWRWWSEWEWKLYSSEPKDIRVGMVWEYQYENFVYPLPFKSKLERREV